MKRKFNYLVNVLSKKFSSSERAFGLKLVGHPSHIVGEGEPAFTLVVQSKAGLAALCSLDATNIAESYVAGAIDIEGDFLRAFEFRDILKDRHPFHSLWCFIRPLLLGQIANDKASIAHHYDYDDEFYMLFLDKSYLCYSHGVFLNDDEPLETAMTRKLDFAIESAGIKPGDRVLDIGAGWGAFTAHAGRKGIKVTALTISEKSETFINRLITKDKLACKVLRQHFFEHQTAEPYDAIVNCGVTEHLPDYRTSLAKYQELLKPGGRLYLDASASREKYKSIAFGTRHIYPGNHSQLCLHNYLEHLANTPFRLKFIYDDQHSYYLTLRHWAQNLERNRKEMIAGWGESLYRRFRIYLWGCASSFARDRFQAYRILLELPQ